MFRRIYMSNFRFGIMGAAKIANKFCEAVSLLDNCEVCAISSKSYDKAKSFATDKGINKYYDNYVEMLEAEGLRDKVILCCGGARISHELAKELGYDAGFGMNTYADDVASYVVEELARRMGK